MIKIQTKNEQMLNKLKDTVGEETFCRVLDVLHGETVYFPNVTDGFFDRKQRNREIRKAFYGGAALPELAEQYNLTEGHIRKIISSIR